MRIVYRVPDLHFEVSQSVYSSVEAWTAFREIYHILN